MTNFNNGLPARCGSTFQWTSLPNKTKPVAKQSCSFFYFILAVAAIVVACYFAGLIIFSAAQSHHHHYDEQPQLVLWNAKLFFGVTVGVLAVIVIGSAYKRINWPVAAAPWPL